MVTLVTLVTLVIVTLATMATFREVDIISKRKVARKLQNTTVISDTCNGWPTDLSHLTTDTSMFPVNYGTSLTVQCKTGYSVTAGDTQITCVKGTSFSWSYPPVCTLGKV